MADKPKRFLTRESPSIEVCKVDLVNGSIETYYIHNADPEKGDDAWKLDVGRDCNDVLDHADYLDSVIPQAAQALGHHTATAQAMRRLVERVAEFENLEME